MFKEKSTRKLAKSIHGIVYGNMDFLIDDPDTYNGYNRDVVAMYNKLIRDLAREGNKL